MQKKSIKNIHLYSVNNKFNKNIFDIKDDDLKINNIVNNQSIYRYLYTNNLTSNKNNVFIFNSSILTKEILDFIANLSEQMNIWIFIDNNFIPIENLKVKYITYKSLENHTYKLLPDHIVNKRLYSEIKLTNKKDQLVYFFKNGSETIADKLLQYLYPRSNLVIKFFDNANFHNPQNLGYLTEESRRDILCESKFYLHDNSNYYVTEALLCGCCPVSLDESDNLIDQMNLNQANKPPSNITYYIDFLKDICND